MIKLQKINNEVVKPIPIKKIPPRNIKGCDLFPELYANVFLLAKKKSGKTSAIYKILKKCADEKSKVVIFASTVHKDPNWIAIVKWLKKKEIPFATYTSFHDEGMNQLDELTNYLQNEEEEGFKDENDETIPAEVLLDLDFSPHEEEKKPKMISPEYIIIMDDLSTELKNPSVNHLLKRNRHFKSKVIISSQYIHDLMPEAIQQLDYILLWPNIPDMKLRKIHENLDLSIDFPLFKTLYENATQEPHNFQYVDIRNEMYRKNFNQQYKMTI